MIIHEYPVQEVDYFAHGHCVLGALQHPATTPRPHDRDSLAAAGVGLGGVPPTPLPRPEIRAFAAGARGGEGGARGREAGGGPRLPHCSHYYYYH